LKFRRQHRDELAINLTPLIDVVFLLLIFFMVSTTFTRETQLTIDLPEAQGQQKETVDEQIEILVDESGNYRVNGEALVDTRMRTLQAAIYKISAGDTTMPMTISADAQAAHQDVVQAMDAAGQMGFVHLSIPPGNQPASRLSLGKISSNIHALRPLPNAKMTR
jgi:biopolymer transport protein ExbD